MKTTGIGLDFEKIENDQWTLYFTAGSWLYNNQIATLEPAIIHLSPDDYSENIIYDVYFSRKYNAYYIKEDKMDCTQDLYLGGFMIIGCELRYFLPPHICEDTEEIYVRAFDEAFNEGYEEPKVDICGDICQPYNDDFGPDFMYSCNPSPCDISIGGVSGTRYIVNNFLLPECIIAKL